MSTDMHLFLRALPKSLRNALTNKEVQQTQQPQPSLAAMGSCKFNPKTKTVQVKVEPRHLLQKLDVSCKIGKKSFYLCLDVSSSMSHHADEMLGVMMQIECELAKMEHLVGIRLLFFSDQLLLHTPLGKLSTVKSKTGWMGGTDFHPPLQECLIDSKAHPEVDHTIIFMTDGSSNKHTWTTVADELHQLPNVRVISVGFGASFNEPSLKRLARTEDDVLRLKGPGASAELHSLLQSVVGCGIELPEFIGCFVVDGKALPATYYPYGTEDGDTGIQACITLPDDITPGATIRHFVDGWFPETELKVITSYESDRDGHILALRHTLAIMRNSVTPATVKQLRTLTTQLESYEATDRRIAQVRVLVEQLSLKVSVSSCGPGYTDLKPIVAQLERFVHALLSGTFVSARQLTMVQKATDKLDAMMAHITRAADIMASTNELVFDQRLFDGKDIVGSVMLSESEQYPILLLENGRACYENKGEYEEHLSLLANSVTLVQPASLCAPTYKGVLFPSEIDGCTNTNEVLDGIGCRKLDAILCVSQSTSAEREYALRMYRIVSALLSTGVPTCAGTNLCWNLASAAMQPMSRPPTTQHPNLCLEMLTTTTLMSYFSGFAQEQGIHAELIGLYADEPTRIYALSNREDSPCKLENVWMSMAAFYSMRASEQATLFRSFAKGLVFESMRQALSAKARKEPNCIQELLQELIDRLQAGPACYNELGLQVDANNRGALWNERPLDFANQDDGLVQSSFEMLRGVLRTSSTDAKTANVLSQIRQLIGVACPPGLTSRLTRTFIDALLRRVLGSTQTRNDVMPNWCGVDQLLSVLNRMSFVIANEPLKFGHISPDTCNAMHTHAPFSQLSELFETCDEFANQALYLLSCGCQNAKIRDTPVPNTLDDLVPLLPRPRSAATCESERQAMLSKNLAAWSTIHNWSADEVVGLYSVIGGMHTPQELVSIANDTARRFQSPAVFSAILRSVPANELEPDSVVRNAITRLLQDPFYAPIVASLNDEMTTRLSKSSCAYPIVGSRRFNRIMATLVRAVLGTLGLPLADGTITYDQFLQAKMQNPTCETFRKGGVYYLKQFRSVSFCISAQSKHIFIDRIGEWLERYGERESRAVGKTFIWGVSELCETSRPECLMRALAFKHMEQTRDHYADLVNKNEFINKRKHYSFVLSCLRGAANEDSDDDQ